MSDPFIAIGNDELGEPLQATIRCGKCGQEHPVENSGPSTTYHADGTKSQGESGLLQFYRCGDKTYLAGIRGKELR